MDRFHSKTFEAENFGRYEAIFIRRGKQILDKIIIYHHQRTECCQDSVLRELQGPNELGLNLKSNLEQCGTSDFLRENEREC